MPPSAEFASRRSFCDHGVEMARKTPAPKELTIAIAGEGITPKDVPLRQLAELLEATAAAFEAIAAEKHLDAPNISLLRVKKGSAAYALHCEDSHADRVLG